MMELTSIVLLHVKFYELVLTTMTETAKSLLISHYFLSRTDVT